MAVGSAYAIDKAVKETRPALSKKLFDLEEAGPTALGPALVLSAAIAGTVPPYISLFFSSPFIALRSFSLSLFLALFFIITLWPQRISTQTHESKKHTSGTKAGS